jgi:hypothetical protein
MAASAACAQQPSAQGPAQIPKTTAKTLAGIEVTIPESGASGLLLVVIAFSHKGGTQAEDWNKRIAAAFQKDATVHFYAAADLEGVPSLVKGMVLHGMRSGTTAEEQARFLLIEKDGAKWKALVNYSAEDDAYVVLATASGSVLWQAHGAATDAAFGELQKQIEQHLK